MDGQQKSAKGKAPQKPDRDFEACARLNERKSEERIPRHSGNCYIITNGVWSFRWDAENRMVAAYSNDELLVVNAYDDQSRRIRKVTAQGTRTFLYDGWNPVRELIAGGGSVATNYYCWGLDLSGTLQGAGGVGGLLAVMVDGAAPATYYPCYDANGNITAYVDGLGVVKAEYAFDAFGQTISSGRDMAATFSHRFSTKYADDETGLYYYGYRYYAPGLGRWLSRDPIEEEGGMNLYGFVGNNAVLFSDLLGTLSTPYNYYYTPHWRTVAKTPREVFDYLWTIEHEIAQENAYYEPNDPGLPNNLYIGAKWNKDVNPSGYATTLAHEMVNALSYYFADPIPGEYYGQIDHRVKKRQYLTGLHQLNLVYEWGMWASVKPDYLTCDEVKRRRDEMLEEYGNEASKNYINNQWSENADKLVTWICACRCGKPAKPTFESYEYKRERKAGIFRSAARVQVQSRFTCKDKQISGGLHVNLEVYK